MRSFLRSARRRGGAAARRRGGVAAWRITINHAFSWHTRTRALSLQWACEAKESEVGRGGAGREVGQIVSRRSFFLFRTTCIVALTYVTSIVHFGVSTVALIPRDFTQPGVKIVSWMSKPITLLWCCVNVRRTGLFFGFWAGLFWHRFLAFGTGNGKLCSEVRSI